MVGHLGLTWAPPACRLASFYGVPAVCQSLPSSSVHALLLPASLFLWISDQEPTPSDFSIPCLILQDVIGAACQGRRDEQVLLGSPGSW